MTASKNVSRALVDNWILELAFSLLANDLRMVFYKLRSRSSYPELWQENLGDVRRWDSELAENALIALLQTLDLLVVNDELVYDNEYSFTWQRFADTEVLAPFFRQVRLSEATKRDVLQKSGIVLNTQARTNSFLDTSVRQALSEDCDFTDDIVSNGALYYLSLSRLLGIYYWPSPKRAEYLSEHQYDQSANSFTLKFGEYIDERLRQITQDVLEPMHLGNFLQLPGFSATIISSSNDTRSVVPTLLQLRNSSPGVKFRQWLRDMDEALQGGNLDRVTRELKQVRDVIAEVRRELGVDETKDRTLELQIGLSPGLTLGADVLKPVSDYFRPKPLHLVFIKRHFFNYLRNANMRSHLNRLFPQIK